MQVSGRKTPAVRVNGPSIRHYTTINIAPSLLNEGSKTPMSQFVCGWVVAFVLLFLTNFFSRIPMNILGSIIIVSVASLVEYETCVYLWKVGMGA